MVGGWFEKVGENRNPQTWKISKPPSLKLPPTLPPTT
jgi:hypothetical protein